MTFASQGGVISQALCWPPLVMLGDASYGLYLWHYMVMEWSAKYIPTGLAPITRCGLVFALIAGVIVFSVATFFAFERPMRRWIAGWGVVPGVTGPALIMTALFTQPIVEARD